MQAYATSGIPRVFSSLKSHHQPSALTIARAFLFTQSRHRHTLCHTHIIIKKKRKKNTPTHPEVSSDCTLAMTKSARRPFRLRRALHQEQQDRGWALVQFRQPSVAGEVLLLFLLPLLSAREARSSPLPPPRPHKYISRLDPQKRHAPLLPLCIIHRQRAINLLSSSALV